MAVAVAVAAAVVVVGASLFWILVWIWRMVWALVLAQPLQQILAVPAEDDEPAPVLVPVREQRVIDHCEKQRPQQQTIEPWPPAVAGVKTSLHRLIRPRCHPHLIRRRRLMLIRIDRAVGPDWRSDLQSPESDSPPLESPDFVRSSAKTAL